MKLEITDRQTGNELTLDSKENASEFFAAIRRLASVFGRPLAEVQEALVCGNTYRTAGFSYTLIE